MYAKEGMISNVRSGMLLDQMLLEPRHREYHLISVLIRLMNNIIIITLFKQLCSFMTNQNG
jgi:hypothetical protein